MKPMQSVIAVALLVGAAAFSQNCTNRLSTQDAYAACTSLQKSDATFGNFNDCVTCFEACGDCQPNGTGFECPGDTSTAGGTTTSTGTGSTTSASTGTGG